MVSEGTYTDRPLVTAAYVAGFVERLVGGRLAYAGVVEKTYDRLWCDQPAPTA
jgi:hypothetical protein